MFAHTNICIRTAAKVHMHIHTQCLILRYTAIPACQDAVMLQTLPDIDKLVLVGTSNTDIIQEDKLFRLCHNHEE